MSNRGTPRLAQHDDERCQALTVMTEWKKAHNVEQRCPFAVKYLVEEKRLCFRHTTMECLAIAIERGDAQRVLYPPPSLPGARVKTMTQGKKP
jgi:hypothetical protein